MKKIPAVKGKDLKYALVDDEDFVLVSKYNWRLEKWRKTYYACCYSMEVRTSMHQFITGYKMCDHKNGDGLDNKRSNLRECTYSQNNYNKGLRSDNKSGFSGVWYDKRAGAYQVYIDVGRKRKFLGMFDNAIDAAIARDKAALRYHGDFAKLNFEIFFRPPVGV